MMMMMTVMMVMTVQITQSHDWSVYTGKLLDILYMYTIYTDSLLATLYIQAPFWTDYIDTIFLWRKSPPPPPPPVRQDHLIHEIFLDHNQRCITVGRTPLDE